MKNMVSNTSVWSRSVSMFVSAMFLFVSTYLYRWLCIKCQCHRSRKSTQEAGFGNLRKCDKMWLGWAVWMS